MGICTVLLKMERGSMLGASVRRDATSNALGAYTSIETCGKVFSHSNAVNEDARRRLHGGLPQDTLPQAD